MTTPNSTVSDELPKLPKPAGFNYAHGADLGWPYYSEAQMRSYATAAIRSLSTGTDAGVRVYGWAKPDHPDAVAPFFYRGAVLPEWAKSVFTIPLFTLEQQPAADPTTNGGVSEDTLREKGLEFLEAAEAVFDWMNGNDLSADHEEQHPDDFRRVSKALVAFRAALTGKGA